MRAVVRVFEGFFIDIDLFVYYEFIANSYEFQNAVHQYEQNDSIASSNYLPE